MVGTIPFVRLIYLSNFPDDEITTGAASELLILLR